MLLKFMSSTPFWHTHPTFVFDIHVQVAFHPPSEFSRMKVMEPLGCDYQIQNGNIIHQGSPKGTPGMTCCHLLEIIYACLILHQIIKPMTLVYKFWDSSRKKKSEDLGRNRTYNLHNSGVVLYQLSYQALIVCPKLNAMQHKVFSELAFMGQA